MANLVTKWLAAGRYYWETLDSVDRFLLVGSVVLLVVATLVWIWLT